MQFEAIGFVRGARLAAEDDYWGDVRSYIELDQRFPVDALVGLDAFSHAEVLFHFHLADPANIVSGARHPRDNAAWPKVGIFAQRGKSRPNRIGSTIVRVLGVQGRTLTVAELDAIEGTPVLDIKPVLREFLPRTEIRQPAWAAELMQNYWKPDAPRAESNAGGDAD